MIYCVVPPELGEEAYRRLVEHYKDNPNIKVIMDRRHGERRRPRRRRRRTRRRDRRRRRAGLVRRLTSTRQATR